MTSEAESIFLQLKAEWSFLQKKLNSAKEILDKLPEGKIIEKAQEVGTLIFINKALQSIKKCERQVPTNETCGTFALRRDIVWKNGINKGGKQGKINSKWSDAEIIAKLTELGFVDADFEPVKEELTEEPFTVGLWVGDSLTPNRYDSQYTDQYGRIVETGAFGRLREMHRNVGSDEFKNSFQIEACPSCGTRLYPLDKENYLGDEINPPEWGFEATQNSFKTRCPETSCMFNREGLPVLMVELTHLYLNSTYLIECF